MGLIHSLLKAGFDIDSLKKYFSLPAYDGADRKGKIRLLRKQRCQLLDEIHGKQQSLDALDYMMEKQKTILQKAKQGMMQRAVPAIMCRQKAVQKTAYKNKEVTRSRRQRLLKHRGTKCL